MIQDKNKLSNIRIGCAIEVHQQLGRLIRISLPSCLHYELLKSGLKVQKKLSCPVIYKEMKLEYGYRVDLLVESLKQLENLPQITKPNY